MASSRVSYLPPEIWFAIIEYLPGKEQLRISQVSPQLCAVARKIVYRNVVLRSNSVAIEAALELLKRDHSVARNVERLHIYTNVYTPKEPPWFDSAVLTGMTNLHALEVTGMLFHTEEDHLKFNNVISESLPSLRQLKYVSLHSGFRKIYGGQGKHLPVLQVSGLQEITWIDLLDTFIYPLHILNPINASRETLTHIRIPVATNYTAPNESLIQFFTLRFPHLSTLQLGGWNTVTPVGAALTSFLVAHPLIEDLNLGFLDPNRWGIHCHLSPDVILSPGALPNLRRLTADASNLGMFLRSRILSLQTLESLHIGVGYSEEQEDDIVFGGMYHMLEVYGELSGLKVLELEFERLFNKLEIARWISGFGRLCPNVEQFRGDFGVGFAAALNQDIFASYTNLRSLVLHDMGHMNLRRGEKLDRVKRVVAHNPSVTELRFYEPDADIMYCYRMKRDMSGGITAMVEVLEDGTEIVWI